VAAITAPYVARGDFDQEDHLVPRSSFADPKLLQAAFREMLRKRKADYFVTLMPNSPELSYDNLLALLKRWDALVNRQLNQAKWSKRPDERVYWFAFTEKLEVNPHWHLLVELDPDATGERLRRTDAFPEIAADAWKKVVRSGTADCQEPYSEKGLNYATKLLSKSKNFERFVLSREFQTDP
jgi:hypothetical protein